MARAEREGVALGFRVHTGWAAMVAIEGAPPATGLLDRRRIELVPAGGDIPRFAYHEASEREFSLASQLVRRVQETARELAAQAVRQVVEELGTAGRRVVAAGVPAGATRVPEDLKSILASHALIHAAEGELFRQALVSASERQGLRVLLVRERDLWTRAATEWAMAMDALQQQMKAVGKRAGPPWSQDQKTAAAAALAALAQARR